jgi:hypothetical protein
MRSLELKAAKVAGTGAPQRGSGDSGIDVSLLNDLDFPERLSWAPKPSYLKNQSVTGPARPLDGMAAHVDHILE